MGLTKWLSLAIAGACASQHASAAPSAELLDLAARVHYGFYHGEARSIETAQTALDRLGDSPEVQYYRDFAALRRAQLGNADRKVLELVDDCAQRDVADALAKPFAAEAWVLVAGCALVVGDERRRDEALLFARERDRDNPRIALVEAWAMTREAGADPVRREALATKLATVVEAFDAWTPSIDDPDWGHAEALTALAATVLDSGQVRTARDLIERALLLAPDYRVAVELRIALQGARGGSRAL
jgi:tetratricopeptide (TPR) repeat protein